MSNMNMKLKEMKTLVDSTSMSPERQKELCAKIPFTGKIQFDQGILQGLWCAVDVMKERGDASAVKELQTMISVAADRITQDQQAIQEIVEREHTPENLAVWEAEFEAMKSGQIPVIDFADTLREFGCLPASDDQKSSNGIAN